MGSARWPRNPALHGRNVPGDSGVVVRRRPDEKPTLDMMRHNLAQYNISVAPTNTSSVRPDGTSALATMGPSSKAYAVRLKYNVINGKHRHRCIFAPSTVREC